MNKLKIERRKHIRSKKPVSLKIINKTRDIVTETVNISCSGVYCRVDYTISLMSKLKITLILPIHYGKVHTTEKIDCTGIVVRSEPVILEESETAYQNIAIFFADLTQKEKDKINQYVLQSSNETVYTEF